MDELTQLLNDWLKNADPAVLVLIPISAIIVKNIISTMRKLFSKSSWMDGDRLKVIVFGISVIVVLAEAFFTKIFANGTTLKELGQLLLAAVTVTLASSGWYEFRKGQGGTAKKA